MNATGFISSFLQKGWVVVALLSLLAVTAFGQDITNTATGTITSSGVIKLKGAFTNSNGAFTSIGGDFEYFNAGPQTVLTFVYSNLGITGASGTKTLGTGETTVGGILTVNQGAGGFDVGSQSLKLTGSGNVVVTTLGSFTASTGTVTYYGNNSQNIYATTYANLATTATAATTKTASGAITVGSTLSNGVNVTMDMLTNTLDVSGAPVTNNALGVIQTAGTVTGLAGAMTGKFVFNASSGTQTIPVITSYTDLTLSGGAVAAGAKTVGALTVLGSYLTSGGERTYSGTFTYGGGSLQTLLGGEPYVNLALSGAGGKQITSGTVTTTGTFAHSNGPLTLNTSGGLTVGTTASFAGLTITSGTLTAGSGQATFNNAVSNSGAIATNGGLLDFTNNLTNNGSGTLTLTGTQQAQIAGVLTSASSGLSLTTGSTFTYNGGVQDVVGATYGNLALTGGTKTITGNAAINGTATGLTADASSPVTVAGSTTTTLGANALATFSGNLTTTGTFDANTNTGTTVTFNGAGQTISGTAILFKALTLSGTAAKTSNVNLTVNGAFTPSQGITMSGSTLTMGASATIGTYGAQAEIVGKMLWNATGVGPYKFNNDQTSVAFSATDGSRTFQLETHPLSAPTGYVAGDYVNRKINATYTGWNTGTADLKIAYTYAERASVAEGKTRDFNASVSSTTKLLGSLSRTTSTNGSGNSDYGSVTVAGLANGSFASGNEIIMSDLFSSFTSIAAADWNVLTTWDEGALPSSTDDVVINTAVTVPDGYGATAKSVLINAGAGRSLTVGGGASGTLTTTLAGAGLTNNGTVAGALTVNGLAVLTINGTLTNNGPITNSGTITVQ
jgi:hypothetical protein